MKPRLPRHAAESQQRAVAHRKDTLANPLSEAEIALWLASLSSLDNAVGKAEQLAVCRDLMANAPDDGMLSSDARIIKMAIAELERELRNAPSPTATMSRRRPRLGDRVQPPEDTYDPDYWERGDSNDPDVD